ncbi:MAG: GspH/FimT family pseudopilin [Pseudomonadota bacterium]
MLTRPLHKPHKEQGMTLVEVMMVVFLIGLTSSIVVFTLPERAKPIERAADTFARDVKMAADRAILTGRVQGIDVLERGYAQVEWKPETQSWDQLRGRQGQRDELQLRLINVSEPGDDVGPELRFDPTGVNSAFDLELVVEGERMRLTLSPDGDVARDES